MPGTILHVSATVLCTHGGQATPTAPSTRVSVNGQPIATLTSPYTIAACPFPSSSGGPCATAQWLVGATRVTADGAPVVIMTGQSTCVPTGTPLVPVLSQIRVTAT